MSLEPFPWPQGSVRDLFGIEHPIIQAGMVWVSGAKLAAAASEAGCLGMLGAGSMKPELLAQQISKARSLTNKALAVNVPLLYREADLQIRTALDGGIRIFFTSAGSPKTFTSDLKKSGALVVHVTSSLELARKCEDAGVDAVVIEGFEAGGHNGRDEITSLVLLQQILGKLSIPVIAAGGFGTGASIAAAFALGAQGVQMGTVFAATAESSAHQRFKDAMLKAGSGATRLQMKRLVPVRLLDNAFARQVRAAEEAGAGAEELASLLGKGRAKRGMHEGDLEEGELEIGQIVSEVREIIDCATLVRSLQEQYIAARARLEPPLRCT